MLFLKERVREIRTATGTVISTAWVISTA